MKWLPENEVESEKLRLTSFRRISNDIPAPTLNFDLVARSFLCFNNLGIFEVGLTFLRQGHAEASRRRYISAFYYFFFFIESMFGNGKFKKQALAQELCKSPELLKALNEARIEFVKNQQDKQGIFLSLLRGTNNDKAVFDYLIERRGFLHHHTEKRQDIWHPERQYGFKIDASFLQVVCQDIAFARVEEVFFGRNMNKSMDV